MKNCIKKITNLTIKSLAVLAIAVVALLGVICPPLMKVANVMAAGYENNIASGLKLSKMPSKAKLNETDGVKVPVGETDEAGATVNCKILNPKGTVIFDSTNASAYSDVKVESGKYVFTAKNVGTYKVQYTVASVAKRNLTTQEYKIVVSGEKATLTFAENSKQIIPSVTNGKYDIVLPYPTVKDSEGNEVEDVKPNLTINVLETYTNSSVTIEKNAEGYYHFTPNSEADCYYVVTYTYVDAISNLETTEVFEIKYEKEFKDEDIKLGYKFNGSIPESMELGKETTLPTVSIYDENDADLALSAYADIEVVFTPNSASKSKYETLLEDGTDYVKIAIKDNKITPMYPSSEGTYKITYKIADFYNVSQNKVNKTLIYSVNDVKDSTAPTTYAVADYKDYINLDAESKFESLKDGYEYKDVSYKIPSKVATNTEVYFPAIYATDNYSSYEDMYTTLARVVVPEKGSNKTLTTCYKEVDGEMKTVDVEAYETASYKFTEAGTYTIRYEATDKANKRNYTGTTFTIVVEDGFVDNVAPKVTLSGVPASVRAGETITVNKAEVVDYATDSATETEIVDKNVETHYYYYTTVYSKEDLVNTFKSSERTGFTEIVENKDGELKFDAPDSASVNVVCVAYDDNSNVGVAFQKINIVNVNDNDVPTVDTNDETYVKSLIGETPYKDGLTNKLDQDNIIYLPEYSFKDGDNTKYLSSKIKVLDKDNKEVSVIGAQYNLGSDKLTISNARFVATKSGEYTIIYTVTDLGGNYLVKSYMVSINDTKAPVIDIEGKLSTVEVGETVKLPTFKVSDESTIVSQGIRFIGDNNPSFSYIEGTNEFIAYETGIFTYEYYAEDNNGNKTISGPYTIEAKDTQKPEITLDYDLNSQRTFPLEKDEDDKIKLIYLPDFTAEDVLNGIKEKKVIVKSPSEKELTVTLDETEGKWKFTPTVDGIYTVVYSATDNANNTTEQTYTLKIGDNTAPSIKIENESANAPAEMKVNSSNLKLSLVDIKVSDNGETKLASELVSEYTNNGYKMFTVTVTGPDGSTISRVDDSGNEYEYKLTQTGKYTITYTARDKAGNEKIVKKTVEVYANESKSVITTETWSIVLIVLSLAILAGVVIYFVKTRDKKPSKKDVAKLTKDDKKDDKKD